jgi:hypothetical protein
MDGRRGGGKMTKWDFGRRAFDSIVNPESDEPSKALYRLLVTASAFVIGVFGVNLYLYNWYAQFGPWGDFIGGVLNLILTFMTFMGLLIT